LTAPPVMPEMILRRATANTVIKHQSDKILNVTPA
jgi:hypothetical protein